MARAARNTSIDPAQIQVVHVWNRCVRRAFLCGVDDYSGRDYEHRRDWARQRLEHLASLFAIDCITYSIMTNHTHQILRSRPDIAASWDDRTVATRWLQISPDRDAGGKPLEPRESEIQMILSNPAKVAELRLRLSDISWWMLDWVGRAIRCDKRGSIPVELDSILSQIGLTDKSLLSALWHFGAPPGDCLPAVAAGLSSGGSPLAPATC